MASENDDFEIVDYDDIEANNSESDFYNLEDREETEPSDDGRRSEGGSSNGENPSERKEISGSIHAEYSSADEMLDSTEPKSKLIIFIIFRFRQHKKN